MRTHSLLTLGLAGLLVGACQGKDAPPRRAAAAKSNAGEPQFEASAEPTPGSAPAAGTVEQGGPPAGSPTPTAVPSAEDDPLGRRFIDPPWFRKDMLEGAKAVNVSRSEADDNGFFSSHILFELPEGTTAERCAEMIIEKVEKTVPDLERTNEADRIKLTGSTDRYRVSSMCGEAKGVMRAFVSFEWFA